MTPIVAYRALLFILGPEDRRLSLASLPGGRHRAEWDEGGRRRKRTARSLEALLERVRERTP